MTKDKKQNSNNVEISMIKTPNVISKCNFFCMIFDYLSLGFICFLSRLAGLIFVIFAKKHQF